LRDHARHPLERQRSASPSSTSNFAGHRIRTPPVTITD
jgi:hypothetical protein